MRESLNMRITDKYFGNMVRNKAKQFVGNIIRWFIGAVFILSSLSKCWALQGFREEVSFYLDVYFGNILREYAMAICIILCAVEFVIGILAFFQKTKNVAMASAVALLSFFVYLTGENFLNPSIFGSYESCGCFGELIHFTPLTSFMSPL